MHAAMTSDEVMRLSPRPPSGRDLVRVSPRVAPRGRVRTYAAQKITLFWIGVKKCAAAPRANPRPELVATKSPSAVPSVREDLVGPRGNVLELAELERHRKGVAARL